MTPARVCRIIVAHQNFGLLEAAAAKEFPAPEFPKEHQIRLYLKAHMPALQPPKPRTMAAEGVAAGTSA